jgi:hypothetical protein
MIRVALVAVLSGCAAFSFTEADCRNVNWQQRGYDDGYGGHPPQDMRVIRECSRFGIQVSEAEYLKGWALGHDEHQRLKTMRDD